MCLKMFLLQFFQNTSNLSLQANIFFKNSLQCICLFIVKRLENEDVWRIGKPTTFYVHRALHAEFKRVDKTFELKWSK